MDARVLREHRLPSLWSKELAIVRMGTIYAGAMMALERLIFLPISFLTASAEVTTMLVVLRARELPAGAGTIKGFLLRQKI